jgi:hypothetical protein
MSVDPRILRIRSSGLTQAQKDDLEAEAADPQLVIAHDASDAVLLRLHQRLSTSSSG